MNAIKFGKFIADLRNEKDLTQEELAEKLYIDKRKISRWECGMSIPDFETLIKLSEMLDVTLYELSICKRIENEKLSKRTINKFKNIKDFKKYRFRKKLSILIYFLLGIFLIITAIYTILYYGTVEIYEFKSLNNDYLIKGTYIKASNYIIYDVNEINQIEYAIYNNTTRVFQTINVNSNDKLFHYGKLLPNTKTDGKLEFQITCQNKKNIPEEYLITFEFVKKYDNKLF